MAVGTKVASLYAELTLDDSKYRQKSEETQSNLQKFGSKVKGLNNNILGIVRSYGAATAGVGLLAKAIISAANEGNSLERGKAAFEAWAGSSKEAAKWIDAIKAATRGTVTTSEAAASAFQIMKFDLADSAEDAGEFARMMKIVAAINPQLGDTGAAIQELQLTLANMSYRRLDQLGLSVQNVKRRMEELRTANANLSEEEAFQIAVMEGLKEQADRVGDAILEVGNDFDWLKAQAREFKEKTAMWIAEGANDAASALRDMWDMATDAPKSQAEAIAQSPEQYMTLIAGMRPGEFTGPTVGLPRYVSSDAMGKAMQYYEYVYAQIGTASAEAQAKAIAEYWRGPGADARAMGLITVEEVMGNIFALEAQLEARKQQSITLARESMDNIQQWGNTLTTTLGNVVRGIGEAVNTFTSLDAKFGVTAMDSYEDSVFGRVSAALGDVGVEAPKVAEVLDRLSWQYKSTTGANEMFNRLLDDTTAKLNLGSMTTEQYVAAVTKLSGLNLGMVNIVTRDMDYDAAMLYIERLSEFYESGVWSGWQGGMTQEEANPWLLGVGLGGGGEENPFQPLIDSSTAATDTITATFQTSTSQWTGEVAAFTDTGASEAGRFQAQWVGAIDKIRGMLDGTFTGTRTLTVSVSGAGGGGTGGSRGGGRSGVPEFAAGGYTGRGSYPFLAMLHPDEYVIPGAHMRGGGRGTTIVIERMEVVDTAQALDSLEREANLRGWSLRTAG